MTKRVDVAGVTTVIEQANLGGGGQGQVHLVHLQKEPNRKLVLKELRSSISALARAEYLCRRNLSALSPAFAAPIVCEDKGDGKILQLIPFAEGVDLESDIERPLPQNLQTCLEFVSLIQLLEENGIVHGDIAPSNICIAPNGQVTLIDLDGYLADDPSVPPPDTVGQWPMLAPEQRNKTCEQPSRESGYFAMAVLNSMILFLRHPTDGLADEPAAVDHYMSLGHWPEHDRLPDPDDLPIAVLGQDLADLFDRGFSLDVKARPGPDEWRRALVRALHNCWVHDCGQAFVAEKTTTSCPGCGAPVTVPATTAQLRIQILPHGPRYGVEVKDRTPIVLGRSTMSGLPHTVSGRHLEILPSGNKLLLRHVGRNPTLIWHQGQWYQLQEVWVDTPSATTPIQLRLADLEITIE
jgi:serine/threonine protein kinase